MCCDCSCSEPWRHAEPPGLALGAHLKTPKVLLTDSGLAAHLMGIDGARLAHDRGLLGGLLESFVAMELAKQAGWSEDAPAMYYFGTHEGDEVDLVLERRGGAWWASKSRARRR